MTINPIIDELIFLCLHLNDFLEGEKKKEKILETTIGRN
jgi:hypothetical protein